MLVIVLEFVFVEFLGEKFLFFSDLECFFVFRSFLEGGVESYWVTVFSFVIRFMIFRDVGIFIFIFVDGGFKCMMSGDVFFLGGVL